MPCWFSRATGCHFSLCSHLNPGVTGTGELKAFSCWEECGQPSYGRWEFFWRQLLPDRRILVQQGEQSHQNRLRPLSSFRYRNRCRALYSGRFCGHP
ncbi:MAG: hypothetical protein QJR13_08030, partial [Bacillota bacterium]|nr:hypothetical protein [Bacillota bacterium]